jgi:hypothetical protein
MTDSPDQAQHKHTAHRRPFGTAEDAVIMKAMLAGPFIPWDVIAKQLPGRTAWQCRERWANYLSPAIRSDPWTADEDRILVEKVNEMGFAWSFIAHFFNGRSDNVMALPPSVALKAQNGYFLSVKPDGSVKADAADCGPSETFAVVPHGNKYNLKGSNGKFFCVEPNGKVVVNRDRPAEWESLEVVYTKPGKEITIKSHHGKYVTQKPDASIAGDGGGAGRPETFKVTAADKSQKTTFAGKRYLKSHHGKFLSAQPNGTLQWNRDAADAWEAFEVTKVRENVYNLKSAHGKYLCVEPNGTVVVNRDAAKEWEAITVVPQPGGKIALKSHHGKFLSAQPNGTIEGNRDAVKEWETITFS